MELHLCANPEYERGVELGPKLADHVRQARLAVDAGFAGVVTNQHVSLGDLQWFPPIPFLSYLAGRCPGIRLASTVTLLPYYNPLLLAESIAFLDNLAEGRFVFGVGPGWVERELHAVGLAAEGRPSAFEEKLVQVERLLRGAPIVVTREDGGRAEVELGLRPRQRPRPPLWLGVTGRRSAARFAPHVDALILSAHPTVDDCVPVLDAFRAARGGQRPGDAVIVRNVFVAETRKRAVELAMPYIQDGYEQFEDWGLHRTVYRGDDAAPPIAARAIVGDPDDVAWSLRQIGERMGTETFVLRIQWRGMPSEAVERAIDLIGEKVLPQLEKTATAGAEQR